MKSFKFLLVLFLTMTFVSCGHFHDDPTKSVWAKGFWIVPWLSGLAAILFGVKAYLSSKSNSDESSIYGYKDNTGNVSIWKQGWIYFTIACGALCIGVIIYANSGYWK